MAQPGLYSTATAVSTKAKVKGKNRKRKKSTMAGEACATKSSPTGEEVHWAKWDRPTDPLDAFNKYLLANNPPSDSPLFAYKTAKGLCLMTCQTFVMCLNKVAQAVGLSQVHSHGICIGATLEYLLHGIPFNVMKVKGCWASNAFQLYLRKHNQILAPYMQSMLPETASGFTRLAMLPVK